MPQQSKARIFKQLHDTDDILILPNAWDAGSAKILTYMGFDAIASTSAGFAYTKAKTDDQGATTMDELLQNAAEIVNVTSLPVSADLENGGGKEPEHVIDTINHAAHIGLVGCTIEDTSYDFNAPIMDFDLSVERIYAGVEAKKQLNFDFMLTARAENYSWQIEDIEDTIKRLQAFEKAGADVLYAPGIKELSDIKLICDNTNVPVNVVVGYQNVKFTIDELKEMGVKRISLGSSFARAAWTGFYNAANDVKNNHSLKFADNILSFDDMMKFMQN